MPAKTEQGLGHVFEAAEAGEPLLLEESLADDRHQLGILHVQVDHHADAHLEQHRVALPVEDRAPEVPVAAQVKA